MAKILIVDDDSRTAGYVSNYLRGAGHECVVAYTGEKAIEFAKANPVDLMVLDVMLPGGASGFEVCRRIRGDADLYTLPILILSAMTAREEITHGLAQGADDYMIKPFDMQQLLQRIEALIRSQGDGVALDELTALPGARATKREVQRRVSCQENFVLACVEPMYLREFSRLGGPEGRSKAIRHMARALTLCGRNLGGQEPFVGHMGGGHFVCLLQPDDPERFCEYVAQTWRTHLPALYGSVDVRMPSLDPNHSRPEDGGPALNLLICLTSRPQRSTVSAQELFEVLTQLRNGALAANQPGIHHDRRG